MGWKKQKEKDCRLDSETEMKKKQLRRYQSWDHAPKTNLTKNCKYSIGWKITHIIRKVLQLDTRGTWFRFNRKIITG